MCLSTWTKGKSPRFLLDEIYQCHDMVGGFGPRILLTACGRREEKPAATTEKKLNVVTTVAPITSIVENIAGEKIQLAGIIPEGINSHTFEPIPSDSKLLSSADLIILNGLDLETPTLKLAQANLKPGSHYLFPRRQDHQRDGLHLRL